MKKDEVSVMSLKEFLEAPLATPIIELNQVPVFLKKQAD